jgi:hypothetical protein
MTGKYQNSIFVLTLWFTPNLQMGYFTLGVPFWEVSQNVPTNLSQSCHLTLMCFASSIAIELTQQLYILIFSSLAPGLRITFRTIHVVPFAIPLNTSMFFVTIRLHPAKRQRNGEPIWILI